MKATPGWYGKLPALGDFARRRLPDSFIERWDAWLQQCLQASRATLCEGWLQQFLGAPVWRFLLLPGAMGSAGWAGVLLPSVDRVGRYFPLTVCASLPAGAPFGDAPAALEHWLAGLEACALLGLDAERGHLRLEAALQELAPPDCTATTGELVPAWPPPLPAGESYWWCRSCDSGWAGFCCPGLPTPQAFAGLLRGRPPGSAGLTDSGDRIANDRSPST